MHTGEHSLAAPAIKALRKVVVVNGNPEVLELLKSALDGGRYDLVFADAGQHAYSIIKREQPDLVVLAVRIDVMEGFQSSRCSSWITALAGSRSSPTRQIRATTTSRTKTTRTAGSSTSPGCPCACTDDFD